MIVTRVRRIFAVAAAAAVIALALGIGGNVPEVSGDPATNGPCLQAPQDVSQSPTGAISGCIRVGALGSGDYTISLQTNLEDDQAVVKKLSPGGFKRGPDGPPVKLSLSPDAGPPGTVVAVTGHVSRPISASGRLSFAKGLGDFMWDGLPQGLMLLGKQIRWRSADSFTAKVTVPAAPWVLDGNPPRVLGWRSGSYPLSVHCVTSMGGCAVAAPEGSAEFKLEVEHPPKWCTSAGSCATLAATPKDAPPDSIVRISGYAPLVGFDVGDNQFLGNIQMAPGRERSTVRFTPPNKAPTLATFGAAPFEVLGSPRFGALGRVRSLSKVTDGQTPIASAPINSRIVAWCRPGAIGMSIDGSRSAVSTAAAAQVLRAEGMHRLSGSGPLTCTDVLPLGGSTLLAAFQGETGVDTGVFADYPVETRDGGRTWTALPVPPGSTPAGFGGFRASGRELQAVYARRVKSRYGPRFDAARPVAEASPDAGASWTPARLSCPPHGPCVTFGPFLPGNCAMGVSTQFVLRSADGGRSWRASPILNPDRLACGVGALVATSGSSVLLVDALSAYPVQRTTDAGNSWRNVSVPVPMNTTALNAMEVFAPDGITVLPEGAVLLTGQEHAGGWQLLRSGSKRWCHVAGAHQTWQFAPQASPITPVGPDLWWLTYGNSVGNRSTPIHVHELALKSVRCA